MNLSKPTLSAQKPLVGLKIERPSDSSSSCSSSSKSEGAKETIDGKQRAEDQTGEITGSVKPFVKVYDPNDCLGDADTFICFSRPEAMTDGPVRADAPLYFSGGRSKTLREIRDASMGLGKADLLVKHISQSTINGVTTMIYDNTSTGTKAVVRSFNNSWFSGMLVIRFDDIAAAFSFVSRMEPVGKCRCCLSVNCSDKTVTPVLTRLHYESKKCLMTIHLFGGPQDKARDSMGEAAAWALSDDLLSNVSGVDEYRQAVQAAVKPQVINPVTETKNESPKEKPESLTLEQMQVKWTPLITDARWKWVNRKQHPLMRLITSENALLTDFPIELGNFTRNEAQVQAFQSSTSIERRERPTNFFGFLRPAAPIPMVPIAHVAQAASNSEIHRAVVEQTHCWDEVRNFDRNYAQRDTAARFVYVPKNPLAIADQLASNVLDVAGDVISIFSKPLGKITGVKMPKIDTSTQYLTWRYVITDANHVFRKIESDTHNGFNRHEWCMATLRRECLAINSRTIGYELVKTYDQVAINCDLANRALSIMVGGDYPPDEAVHIINANINVYASEYAESVHDVTQYGTILQNTAQFVMVQYTHYYFARGPGSLVYPSF